MEEKVLNNEVKVDSPNDNTLENVVKESAAKIEASKQVKPKRTYNKSGKYSKTGDVKPLPEANSIKEAEISIKPEAVDAVLSDMLKVPFDFLASKAKSDLIKLTDAEALTLGKQLNLILQQYLPNFAGKHPVLISFMVTFSFTAYQKVMIYKSIVEAKKAESTEAI